MVQDPARRPARRPTGRRAGVSGTRDDILDAALTLFAEHGYDGTSIRAVAAAAGVDPALIRHFFGDKATLFTTTVADRTSILKQLGKALPGDPADVGRRVTDTYLRLWEEPSTRPILLAVVRSATTSARAADMLAETLGTEMRAQTDIADAGDDRARRVALAGSHLMGLAFARHILRLPLLAALDHDTLVAAVAPTIQRYLAPDWTARPDP